MLQTSLLLMKSLNKTETPIFLSVVCSLFPKAIFLTFILQIIGRPSVIVVNRWHLQREQTVFFLTRQSNAPGSMTTLPER